MTQHSPSSLIPLEHPEYGGFELEETRTIRTGELKRMAEKLDRSEVEAPYTVYRIYLYEEFSPERGPVEKGELLTCPKAGRAEVFIDGHSEGVDCSSPEDAVRTLLSR